MLRYAEAPYAHDYGVTLINFGYVALCNDVICPFRFGKKKLVLLCDDVIYAHVHFKKNRYVTQRRHMFTSYIDAAL